MNFVIYSAVGCKLYKFSKYITIFKCEWFTYQKFMKKNYITMRKHDLKMSFLNSTIKNRRII
jgi:hypothetical protein